MSLIDDRGRVAAKWNVIDLAVVLLIVVMIPVGYGAFVLFRKPDPTITAITPTRVPEAAPPHIRVTGANLRAFVRARVGGYDSPLAVESPTRADLRLPDGVLPGTYDVTLYDEGRELARLPNALTVVPTPPPPKPPPPVTIAPPSPSEAQVQIVGAFVSVTAAEARQLRSGVALARAISSTELERRVATILTARPAEPALQPVRVNSTAVVLAQMTRALQVPAILRVRCTTTADLRCTFGETAVEQPSLLSFVIPTGKPDQPGTSVTFRIDQVRAVNSPMTFPPLGPAEVTVRVQFVGTADVVDRLKAGDVDRIGGATLIALDSTRVPVAGTSTAVGAIEVPQTYLSVNGTLRVSAIYAGGVWQYDGRPLSAGDAFGFRTLRYSIAGTITDAQVPAAAR